MYLVQSREALLKSLLATLGVILLFASALLIYKGYQEHTSPTRVYGSWLEMQVVGSSRDVLMFNETGVFRNNHLLTTRFDFDGSIIRFKTGQGEVVYQLRGKAESPRLKRIQPKKPSQVFIKKGYEHTLKEQPRSLRGSPRAAFSLKPDKNDD